MATSFSPVMVFRVVSPAFSSSSCSRAMRAGEMSGRKTELGTKQARCRPFRPIKNDSPASTTRSRISPGTVSNPVRRMLDANGRFFRPGDGRLRGFAGLVKFIELAGNARGRDVGQENGDGNEAGALPPVPLDQERLAVISDAVENLARSRAQLRHGERGEVEPHAVCDS